MLIVCCEIGDLWSYNAVTKKYIVSPEPDTDIYSLEPDLKSVVLGSDGLINVLQPQQIAHIVLQHDTFNGTRVY